MGSVSATRRSSAERVFNPPDRSGAFYLGGAAALAGLLALALLARSILVGISFAGFVGVLVALVLLGAGLWCGYWAWACATLRYGLRDGILIVHLGLSRDEVPVTQLQRATRGRATVRPRVTGLDLLGCHIGWARVGRMGPVRVLSLHRAPEQLLYLTGPNLAYAICVADTAGFVRALQDELLHGSALDAPRVVQPAPLVWLTQIHRATLAQIGVAAALALVVTGIIAARYAGFADVIAVNFPENGSIGVRARVLLLPLLAWLLVLLNAPTALLLTARGKAAAATLLYGLIFLEVMLVVAAVTVV